MQIEKLSFKIQHEIIDCCKIVVANACLSKFFLLHANFAIVVIVSQYT